MADVIHSSLVWSLAGHVAAFVVVTSAARVARRPADRPADRALKLLLASLVVFFLGLFGALFLPMSDPEGGSVMSFVTRDDAPLPFRLVFGVVASLPLVAVVAIVAIVARRRTPGKLAAGAFQLLAVTVLAAIVLENLYVVADVREHPAHLLSLLGAALALCCGVAVFFRAGWQRLGLAVAALLFAAAPFLGQLVAVDLRGGFHFEGVGVAVHALVALLTYGVGIAWALVVAPRAFQARPGSPRISSLPLWGRWGAGVGLVVVAAVGIAIASPSRSRGTTDEPPGEPAYRPSNPDERYPPVAWHQGSLADRLEPWPSSGPWRDEPGDGPFALVLHGAQPKLFQVDAALYAALFPRLLRVEPARLVDLPEPPHPSGSQLYEEVWRDASGRLAVWEDAWRHYANPGKGAAFFTLAGETWTPAPELRATRESGRDDAPPRVFRLAAGRLLLLRRDGARWADDGAELRLRDPDPRCRPWWELPIRVAVVGDDAWIATAPCRERPSVFHVARDGVVTARPPVPVADLWATGLHVLPTGQVVLIGPCSRGPNAYDQNCVLRSAENGWSDETERLDGMDLAATRMSSDGTIWALLAHDGNGASGLARPRGPVPSGELHRRAPDGRWDVISFPNFPLPDWECLRFAPIELGLADDTPWVAGKWYYVRHPRPDVVETFVYGGLFRLGPAGDAPLSVYERVRRAAD